MFDDAASAFAEMALLTATATGAPAGNSAEALNGKALEYAAQAFKVTEQSRARSLLDLLSETNGAVTEGIPADLLKRKQDNLDRQQEIAEVLTGISLSTDADKKKPSDLESELEKLQADFEEIENQIRTASPRYANLTGGKTLSLAEVRELCLTIKLCCSNTVWEERLHIFGLSRSPAYPSTNCRLGQLSTNWRRICVRN